MTQHEVFLELQTTVSMTANDNGVIAVGMQVAQVSSSTVIPNVVLPPLRTRATLEYNSRVVLPYVLQQVLMNVEGTARHRDNRGLPLTSKHIQPAPSFSCSCSSDNQAHSQGGTTRTLLLFTRSILYDDHGLRGLKRAHSGHISRRALPLCSLRNYTHTHNNYFAIT